MCRLNYFRFIVNCSYGHIEISKTHSKFFVKKNLTSNFDENHKNHFFASVILRGQDFCSFIKMLDNLRRKIRLQMKIDFKLNLSKHVLLKLRSDLFFFYEFLSLNTVVEDD